MLPTRYVAAMPQLDPPTWVAIFGLTLDIIGVGLLWRFGLPENVKRGGVSYLRLEQDDPIEAAKAQRYDRISAVGLGLIVSGFLWQLAGTALR